MFTKAQEAMIEDAHKMVVDFNQRLCPLIVKQDEEIKKYGAVVGSIGDKVGNMEAEYKRNNEEMLRKMNQEFSVHKQALDTFAAKHQGLIGVGTLDQPEFLKSIPGRLAQHENYRKALEAKSFRHMKAIELDDAEGYKNAIVNGLERKWTEGLTGSNVTSLRTIHSTQRLTEIFGEPFREDHVRDYWPVIPVSTNAIEYWQQTDFASDGNRPNAWSGNAADTVAEGGAKPYSTMTGQTVTAPIRTLAHIFVMSEQLLQDAPAFARHVDIYMKGGLDEKEDVQLLKGSNTGSDLEGLLLRTGIQSYTQSSDPLRKSSDTIVDMICRASSKLRRGSYRPDGLMVGIGAETEIKLTKGNDGQYIWTSNIVATNGQLRIWGLPVLGTGALDDDEGVLGAFRMSVGILDRMTTALRVSDSHDNLFELNMVALRYEKRIGLMLLRPRGICKLIFDELNTES